MASVRVIPATIHSTSAQNRQQTLKKRTAAYARVSTDSEEQLTSYEAQVDYYTKYIKERPDCEFVGIYTDEGINGLTGMAELVGVGSAGAIGDFGVTP